ncbi:MAG TPA: acyltransferase domain-containing protein [Planctomycetota bacterium]|nr:acyltransferase domain-containing protein [Planctomycetota bacterium]
MRTGSLDSEPWNDPERLFASLGLAAPSESVRATWPASQATYPATRPEAIPFLAPSSIAEICDRIALPAQLREAVSDALAVYDRHPALRRLAWHQHHRLASTPMMRPVDVGWPVMPESLGPGGAFVHMHVLLSRVPALLAFHGEHGVPEDVTLATFADFPVWIEAYRTKRGVLGFDNPGWLTYGLTGRLYRLGRLQFEHTAFWLPIHVYRHRVDRRVVALAADGQRFRDDGQCDGADGVSDAERGFTTRFTADERTIIGHRITPMGAASREATVLPAPEWRLVLQPGSPVLNMHIPRDGRMDHAGCGASIAQAFPFFDRLRAEWRGAAALVCASWLMDPQFEGRLEPTSNIVRFLSEFHLLPNPKASDAQTFERVFGGPVADLDRAPQDSSLRRAIVAHARAGGRWRDAAGFILRDDLDWGSRTYRRMDV